MRIAIARPRGWKLLQGESISVNGICTTVEKIERSVFRATYMPETLRSSTAADLNIGDVVNLERSLNIGDRLDGHFVQGHVDCIGVVTDTAMHGANKGLRIRIPRSSMRFVALKGSIAVQGVSLTVAKKGVDWCMVALIPHTLRHTNLNDVKKGDRVNIETDLIARHLAALKGR